MFIHVKRLNLPCLLNIHKIEALLPSDDGKTTSVKAEGRSFEWAVPFDQAQEMLIDCAAQVTAPIASRITGLDNTLARTARSVEELLERMDRVMDSPLATDLSGMSPEEEARFLRTMEETRATLDSIQPRLRPRHHVGLDSDVYALVTMLKNGEYAEHWAETQFGQTLEAEITKLVGHDNAAASRIKSAEELLAGVWHEWNNDDGVSHALGQKMGKEIGDFLWPNGKKTCEKE